MTIVLPHGVLFRGNEEGNIRKHLVGNRHIDAIIGLPANVFFGTSIPTIILVLKKTRKSNDILFVDASQGFEKQKNQNVLRARDIKKIVDTVTNRTEEKGYSRVASYQEIKDNDFNLNIPRYIDSFNGGESVDLYASVYGGIPKKELSAFGKVWRTFPTLFETLFVENNSDYVALKQSDLKSLMNKNQEVEAYQKRFTEDFMDYPNYLRNNLVANVETINEADVLDEITDNLFERLEKFDLVDKYYAYQLLANAFTTVSEDMEMIQSEGIQTIKKVDPNEVEKTKKGKKVIVQEGWLGHILPFELVQNELLNSELKSINDKKNKLLDIELKLSEIKDSLSEEDNEFEVLNNDNTKFAKTEVNRKLAEFQGEIELSETILFDQYLALNKKEKETFVLAHPEINWSQMISGKNGYTRTEINKYLKKKLNEFQFPKASFEAKLVSVSLLLEKQGDLKKEIKLDEEKLHELTKETIEGLTNEEALRLLDIKWNRPLVNDIKELLPNTIEEIIVNIKKLNEKYSDTLVSIESEMKATNVKLASLIEGFTGSTNALQALDELKGVLFDD